MYPKEVRRKIHKSKVAMADLDPRTITEDRLEPLGNEKTVAGDVMA